MFEKLSRVLSTVKALLRPRGAYLILDLAEGGLMERGLFTKSNDIFGSFSVLLSHILWNQQTILRFRYINSTQFLSQTILKLTCKVVSQSKWKNLVNPKTLHKWGA